MRHPSRPRTPRQLKNDAYVVFTEWGPSARIPRSVRLASEFPMVSPATIEEWIRDFEAVEKTIWSLAPLVPSLAHEAIKRHLRQQHSWMEDEAASKARARCVFYAVHEGYEGGPNRTRLSDETWKRVRILFDVDDYKEVVGLLETECSANLPSLDPLSAQLLERCRFAALKISGGDVGKLREALELANTDWRDLLVAADFAESTTAHLDWEPERPSR